MLVAQVVLCAGDFLQAVGFGFFTLEQEAE
jgi:hypothetical protein